MLLGRSGSGKTTSLKLINRLLEATAGEVGSRASRLAEWEATKLRRRIGYAIQDVGLFPHYTVFENVALVPKLEQWEPAKIAARVEEVLALVGIAASRNLPSAIRTSSPADSGSASAWRALWRPSRRSC